MPRSVALAESQCLTDELLTRLIAGELGAEELAGTHRHAAECAECRELLVTVAHGGLLPEDTGAPPPEPPAPGWTPPDAFDEFRLVRRLGRGAMGVVYLAHDQSLDRQVAVKFIAAPHPKARARERFQTEARAIARLQHPNVVTVFRTGEVGGHPYIVSEYLTGQSLAALPLPLPWRRALGLGIGLARGLAAAHRHGVLHRDLKPDNIFLTAEGEVKLLDFGLAELVDTTAPSGPSGARAAAGTPRYMAPELFRGASATPRSDLYALGLILYELCTGLLPPRPRPDPLMPEGEQHGPGLEDPPQHDSLPPLTERVQGIDPDFASVIERCLRLDPEERFASADVLCTQLEHIEQPHEPDVLSAGNPYRGLAPFEAEHRSLFFGRTPDIRAVLDRLRRHPIVLVAGDSGVGKSSLCRAGILPRVVKGALDELRDFSTLTLEPGRRPIAALAASLAPILGQAEAELDARLTGTPNWLGPALRAAYQQGRGLLLFVDQLEELVTISEPAQAVCFARILGELALPATGVRVLLSVRGDFLTRVGALPGLGDAVEQALYLLKPLTPEGVREAIVGPARSRGMVFESEALLQTLVEATAKGAGSLPLLQFTLAELWERRDTARGCITRAALDQMGGVAGALSRHADGVLARLDRAEQQAARRLLGRLITAEGTRSERSEEELTADSGEARAALRALVEGRLLHARTDGGRASYEIAHEALIASWGTLRHWLDEDAGQRALRQRIEAASSEWERLGRTEEVLWRQRQIDEARALETSALGPREQAFLSASQRAVRRQGLRRQIVALLLVLTAGGIYGGLRLQASLETQRFVSAQLAAAQAAWTRGRDLGWSANEKRSAAIALFNRLEPFDPRVPISPPGPGPFTGAPLVEPGNLMASRLALPNSWPMAEKTWALTLADLKDADTALDEAERALEDALERVPDHPDAREFLIQLTYERILLAESFQRAAERERLMQRFERLTARDSAWKDRLATPAALEIVTSPPGAKVELTRYVDDDKGALRREPVPGLGLLGTTPMAQVALPAGSYHLHLTRAGYPPIDLPILLDRGVHQRVDLKLPATVPEGYVYIPPGCFLTGSADPEEVREFLHSAPLHRNCLLTEGYLIGRTEVTFEDWLTYLNELPAKAPARSILAEQLSSNGGALSLRQLPNGSWSFSLKLESGDVLTANAGEPIRYPGRSEGHRQQQDWRRFPLAGVSPDDVTGYLSWLDRSGRLKGARLCNELEWMRAASGADDRRFPHGNRIETDDANIDVTYGRRPDAFGPDEVGSHPTSMSPFGLLDMAGNAFEIVRPTMPDLSDSVMMGGAWYFERVSELIANRQVGRSTLRDVRVGLRVCADMPRP